LAADLDQDGDLDVLSASPTDDAIAWYENRDGKGDFGPRRVITSEAHRVVSLLAADLDRDGDLDVLAASQPDDAIAWYANIDGSGVFGQRQVIASESEAGVSLCAQDFDGDGDLDLLSGSGPGHAVAWYENVDGAGVFSAPRRIGASSDSSRRAIAVDLDGDGDADVVSGSSDDHAILWYENTDGAGGFGRANVIGAGADPFRSMLAADLDRDGDLDLLAAASSDDVLVWYENTEATFGPATAIASLREGLVSLATADLDRDGDVDLLAASATGFEWYRNDEFLRDAESAVEISAPSMIEAEIQVAGEIDWYVFAAERERLYAIEVELETLKDSRLQLLDSDGQTQLAEDDDGGSGLASRLAWKASSSDSRYVTVQGSSGLVGAYRLHLSELADDHGNDGAEARRVGVPSTTEGQVEAAGEVDWFVFSAVEGTEYRIETTVETPFDSILRLLDSDGTASLARNDDGGVGLGSRLVWLATTSADYYVEVAGFDKTHGRYQLGISATGDEHPTYAAGDSDRNGQFDQWDIVLVLQAAAYRTGQPAQWNEGDWNGDGRFDQLDIVAALQTGLYLQGPYLNRPA
jgi:hypothetical protein